VPLKGRAQTTSQGKEKAPGVGDTKNQQWSGQAAKHIRAEKAQNVLERQVEGSKNTPKNGRGKKKNKDKSTAKRQRKMVGGRGKKEGRNSSTESAALDG